VARSLIHLDTSFLIRALGAESSESTDLRLWWEAGARGAVSSVAWTEFLCGPLERRQLELASAIVGEPVAFTGEDSRLAAELFNSTGRRRRSIGDCMIAAAAMRLAASLATANKTDFRRFTSLKLASGA